MTQTDPILRPATKEDAHSLADLINFAGEGMPLYLWGKMAAQGESAWDVGRARACREEGSFSYLNAVVVEHGSDVASCLIGYVIDDKPDTIDPDTPAMFVPLIELENEALSSWYINVLGTYPEHRGKGIGTLLLDEASRIAEKNGLSRLSLIASDSNVNAIRLYERYGFEKRATRPMEKEDWESSAQNWILMIKDLN